MGGACSKGVLSRVAVSPSPEEAQPAGQRAPALQHALPVGYQSRRRGSVSAEPSGNKVKRPARQSIAKPNESWEKIRELVRNTLLFKELDEEQQSCIIDAMFERRVEAGEVVIREGEEADNFYVIESGTFVATKSGGGGGAQPVQAAKYEGKGSFGELALMYNCPRAATVTALSEGVLWGVDRATFRSLVVFSMAERRQRYEATLRGMPIFRDLTQEQLAAVADCLHQETFEAGEYIVWEGAPLDDGAKFYIIEAGSVDCFRTFEGKKRAVKGLQAGDVFGEVALLTKAPRQADCVAATQVKCLTMSRDAFERLMGPVEQVLAQHIAQYQQSNAQYQQAGEQDRQQPGGAEARVQGEGEAGAASSAVDITAAEAETEAETGAGPAGSMPAGTAAPVASAGSPCADPSPRPSTGPRPAAAAPPVPLPLPGSPRPAMLRLSDSQGGGSLRKSTRGSARSSANSEADGCQLPSGSPTALLLLLQQQQQQQAAGVEAGGSAAGPAGCEAVAEGEESASCLLPPIQEEPSDAAASAAAAAAAAADGTATSSPPGTARSDEVQGQHAAAPKSTAGSAAVASPRTGKRAPPAAQRDGKKPAGSSSGAGKKASSSARRSK